MLSHLPLKQLCIQQPWENGTHPKCKIQRFESQLQNRSFSPAHRRALVCSPWCCETSSRSVQKCHSVAKTFPAESTVLIRKYFQEGVYEIKTFLMAPFIQTQTLILCDHNLLVLPSTPFPRGFCKQRESIIEAQDSCRRKRWNPFRYGRVKNVVQCLSHCGNSYCEQVNVIRYLARCLSERRKHQRWSLRERFNDKGLP